MAITGRAGQDSGRGGPGGAHRGRCPQDGYAAEADEILALEGVPKVTEITGVFRRQLQRTRGMHPGHRALDR